MKGIKMLKILKPKVLNQPKKMSLADIKKVAKNNNFKTNLKETLKPNYEKGFYDFEESGFFISDGKVYSVLFPR